MGGKVTIVRYLGVRVCRFDQIMSNKNDNNDGESEPSTDGVTAQATSTSFTKVLGETSQSEAAGVRGNATAASTQTYGVVGTAESDDASAVAVRADAPNGAMGVDAVASGNFALDAQTSGYTAINADTDGQGYNAVAAHNQATDGWSWGVRGETDSTHSEGYGVKGLANAPDGSGAGVGGETDGSGAGAAGVRGKATNANGKTFGVDGTTQSSDLDAAGVRGQTTANNQALLGESYDSEGNLPSLTSSESAGVYGRSDRSGYHYGVAGWSRGGSGMFARSDSSSHAALIVLNSAGGPGIQVNSSHLNVDDYVSVGRGVVHQQRDEPTTAELSAGEVMTYNSDGSDGNTAGDLVYAFNDAGTIRTQVIAQESNAT